MEVELPTEIALGFFGGPGNNIRSGHKLTWVPPSAFRLPPIQSRPNADKAPLSTLSGCPYLVTTKISMDAGDEDYNVSENLPHADTDQAEMDQEKS